MLGRKWATSTDLEKEKWREEAEKLNQLEREKSNVVTSSFSAAKHDDTPAPVL